MTAFARNAEYNLYRVTQDADGGTIWQRHLIDAIGMAHLDHGVDIINISLGNDHSSDGNTGCRSHRQPCKIREAVNAAIGDGIPVIAAAGNAEQYDSVCCPSLAEKAISVGGAVTECTARLDVDNPISLAGRETRPPNACWISYPNDEIESGVYCSGLGCSPNNSCDNHRRTIPWEKNVDPVDEKPDILAPAMVPFIWNYPQLTLGSSWAAAFVSAQVIELLAGLHEADAQIPPESIRQAIRKTAKGLDGEEGRLFYGQGLVKQIYDKIGLGYDFDSDSSFDIDTIP